MKTLNRLFRIIGFLEKNKNLKLQDISNMLNLHKSTVHRYLKSMIENGFAIKNEDSEKYSLGLRFVSIGSKLIISNDIRKVAHPYIKELGKLTGETIHLTTLDDANIVYIDKNETENPIRMYSKIGKIVPTYCTAAGKVMLAFQKKEKKEEILRKIKFFHYTKNTITNRRRLISCLEEIKKLGYAIDNREHEDSICCIAAPIRDSSESVKYAISISILTSKTSIPRLLSYKDELLKKAKIIKFLKNWI